MQCILLTGANSGIGFATCKLLTQNGYFVFAGAKDNNGFKFLTDQKLNNIEPVLLDLTNKEHLTNVVKKIIAYCKDSNKFYALINNAAFATGSPIELTDIETIKYSFEVNLFGVIELINGLLPIIRKDQGRIINISSTNAILSFPYLGIYSATKYALEAVSDSLRMELSRWNIPVCNIYPDVVKTPIFDKSIPLSYKRIELYNQEKQDLYRKEYDAFIKVIYKLVSKGVEPDVIAKCILKCLNSKKPKISYFPEANGKITLILKKICSKKVLDRFLLKQLK